MDFSPVGAQYIHNATPFIDALAPFIVSLHIPHWVP